MVGVEKAHYGLIGDESIDEYTLYNQNGMLCRILSYGGIITQLHTPGRDGIKDVVLGFDSLENYLQDGAYMGAIVGRFANRIQYGCYGDNGKRIQLECNEFPHHLHGGFQGFNRHNWFCEPYRDNGDICLRMHRVSPDGEGGYPGNLVVQATYRLTDDNRLSFEVHAITDQATPVNIVQHSYFNLAGHDEGVIHNHQLQIKAPAVTVADSSLIPTGEYLRIAKSIYDFNEFQQIGYLKQLGEIDFDVNYVLEKERGFGVAAIIREPYSGRSLTISTTKPGLQLYDGAKLSQQPLLGKQKTRYPACGGMCLEPQFFPDSVNKQNFPSPFLQPGEVYSHRTEYAFSVE